MDYTYLSLSILFLSGLYLSYKTKSKKDNHVYNYFFYSLIFLLLLIILDNHGDIIKDRYHPDVHPSHKSLDGTTIVEIDHTKVEDYIEQIASHTAGNLRVNGINSDFSESVQSIIEYNGKEYLKINFAELSTIDYNGKYSYRNLILVFSKRVNVKFYVYNYEAHHKSSFESSGPFVAITKAVNDDPFIFSISVENPEIGKDPIILYYNLPNDISDTLKNATANYY